MRKTLMVVVLGLLSACAPREGELITPPTAMEQLLEADRAYAASAASMNVVDAVGQLLAPDAWMPSAGVMYRTADSALAALRGNPRNLGARLAWAPHGGGISADGQHGFTYGFMTLTDSATLPLKYLAYWVKGADGWKAVAYKRAVRGPGDPPTAPRAPLLPAQMREVNQNEAEVARIAEELGDAERAFSDLAGRVGLGPAFQQNAAPDAMNLGGPPDVDFVYGPEAIAAAADPTREVPSTLTWGPDHVIVASSGDLGVSIGHINIPGPDGNARQVPFFTIWRNVDGTWRFVAE